MFTDSLWLEGISEDCLVSLWSEQSHLEQVAQSHVYLFQGFNVSKDADLQTLGSVTEFDRLHRIKK